MSTTWSLQRDQIISAALRKLAVLAGGTAPETYQVNDAAEALNAMIKTFQVDGMPIWETRSYTFTTVAGTAAYTIGVGQTLNIDAPLKITQAWRNQSTTSSNVPMNIYTDYNYNLLPLTISSGTPVNLYYQPKGEVGQINLWPKPNDSVTTITIRYQRPFDDVLTSTSEVDFPSYWTEALIYGLASRLAPEYGVPLQDRQMLKAESAEAHTLALSYGTEEGSMYFMPDWAGKFK